MADKRPFVDRRLGVVVLFNANQINIDKDEVYNQASGALDIMNTSAYVTNVTTKNRPPQVRVILNESSMSPGGITEIANRLGSEMEATVGSVQRTDIVSIALSPGDKVRNTLGV